MKVLNIIINFVCIPLLLGCSSIDTSFHPQDPLSQYKKVSLFKGEVTSFKYRRSNYGGYEIRRENNNNQMLLYPVYMDSSTHYRYKAGDLAGYENDFKFLLVGYYKKNAVSNKSYKGRYIQYTKALNGKGEIPPSSTATLHAETVPPGGRYAEYIFLDPEKIDQSMGLLYENSRKNDNHEDHNIHTEKLIIKRLYNIDNLVREERISVSEYFYMMYRIPRPGRDWKS